MRLSMLWGGVLEALFPPLCLGCQRVGSLICEHCWRAESFLPLDLPPLPQTDGFVALVVHGGLVREALHALKYEGMKYAARPLAQRLAPRLPWTFETIVPVPLHASRLQERGYNQANVLAQELSHCLSCSVHSEALARIKVSRSQVGLTAQERRENVADAFVPQAPIPATVLLLDDVCTTGATLEAAAQALRQGGATTVYAATVSLAHYTPAEVSHGN
jgi:ComF family protein